MGTLDFLREFEGRALDAATYKLLERNYELQEENNRQLKEAVDRLKQENQRLSSENQQLKDELNKYSEDTQFEVYEGFAFKRKADGTFDSHGYCPTCKVIMSNPMLKTYLCPNCQYTLKGVSRPDVFARQLNSKNG